MKKNLFLLFISVFAFFQLNQIQAQVIAGSGAKNDSVLLIVAGDTVTKSEFLTVYNKNNIKKETVIDKKSMEEYLELYVNFKLKVKEAEALGMDTVSSFVTELAGYRKELSKQYLVNKEINEKLVQEVYDRMQWNIRASHILILVGENASPADTMKAYKRIMKIREMALNGMDFNTLAADSSDDKSAKDQVNPTTKAIVKGNRGDLGYFTAMDLIYSFETSAYNTKVGEISMPVRTKWGYHIIKVTDRIPAIGDVQLGNILVAIPANATKDDSLKAYTKIKELYDSLKTGSSFESLAKKYSDEKSSSAKGGLLPWMGIYKLPSEFVSVINGFKNDGDYSEPILTKMGWFIIKQIDRKPIGDFETLKTSITKKIDKSDRMLLSKEVQVSNIKTEYKFTEYPETLTAFYKIVTDSITKGKWNIEKARGLEKIMFTLGTKQYTQQDFAKYLSKNLVAKTGVDSAEYVRNIYKQWVDASVVDYEDSRLEIKYPEFKTLMKEYRDGILLFELMDKKVWSKAIKDTTGLEAYYEKNKNNYMWEDRLEASVYTCANEKISKATRKYVKKGKLTNDEIMNLINKDSQLNLTVESGKFEKTDTIISGIPWVVGISADIKRGNSVVFAKVKSIIPSGPKSLSETRGVVTADYQTYLDREWIAELKNKYPVTINWDVFSTIK